MTPQDQPGASWVAGLLEHRVALGIAALASLSLVVLLIIGPDEQTARPGDRQAVTATHPPSADRRFSIPERSGQAPATRTNALAKPPAVAAITPATPSRPAPQTVKPTVQAIKPPAKQATLKPVTSKPAPTTRTTASTPAKPAPAPTVSVSTPGKVYFVQVGAYRERSSAQQQAAMLLQKGWNSVVSTNTRGLFVVRIGPASDRKAADELRKTLLNKAKLKGFVVEG